MVIVTLFIMAKKWKLTYPSTDKWINKIWYVHTIDAALAIRRMSKLPQATTQMNLENMKLCESRQTQKAAYYRTVFTGNGTDTESR